MFRSCSDHVQIMSKSCPNLVHQVTKGRRKSVFFALLLTFSWSCCRTDSWDSSCSKRVHFGGPKCVFFAMFLRFLAHVRKLILETVHVQNGFILGVERYHLWGCPVERYLRRFGSAAAMPGDGRAKMRSFWTPKRVSFERKVPRSVVFGPCFFTAVKTY